MAATTRPECPGCAYDQSGHIAVWGDSCPLTGRCTECGCEFEWSSVFDPRRSDTPGFVEHARDRTELALWSVLTFLWTLWPPKFWRLAGVTRRTQPSCMARWLIIMFVPVHVAASLLGIIAGMSRPGAAPGGGEGPWFFLASYFLFPVARVQAGTPLFDLELLAHRWPGFALPALAYTAAFPLLLVCLPATRRLARVKASHVARAVTFSFAWVVPLALFRLGRNIESLLAVQSAPNPGVFAWTTGPRRISESAPELWGILIFAWISIWWLSAFVIGWRLSRALLVWALLTVAAALAAAIAGHWEDLLMVYFMV